MLYEEGRKPTTKLKVWVYCNEKFSGHSIVIFDYHATRREEHSAEFLNGFTGYPVCYGFDDCNAVTGAKRRGCWTHLRRRFVEALPRDKSAHKTSVAAKAVECCNEIYPEEGLLANVTVKERYEQRLVKVKPLLDEFFVWLETLHVSGKNKLAEAVGYALNKKKYLYAFLFDGSMLIDNNRAENAIRPIAVGRKNWLFSNTATERNAPPHCIRSSQSFRQMSWMLRNIRPSFFLILPALLFFRRLTDIK